MKSKADWRRGTNDRRSVTRPRHRKRWKIQNTPTAVRQVSRCGLREAGERGSAGMEGKEGRWNGY